MYTGETISVPLLDGRSLVRGFVLGLTTFLLGSVDTSKSLLRVYESHNVICVLVVSTPVVVVVLMTPFCLKWGPVEWRTTISPVNVTTVRTLDLVGVYTFTVFTVGRLLKLGRVFEWLISSFVWLFVLTKVIRKKSYIILPPLCLYIQRIPLTVILKSLVSAQVPCPRDRWLLEVLWWTFGKWFFEWSHGGRSERSLKVLFITIRKVGETIKRGQTWVRQKLP